MSPASQERFTLGPQIQNRKHACPYVRKPGDPPVRRLLVFSQDPSTSRFDESVVELTIPYEPLNPGPDGSVICIVDSDDTTGVTYEPADLDRLGVGYPLGLKPSTTDPRFAQQMTYGVTSAVYERFRQALGRIPDFGFDACSEYKLRIRPHAGNDANAMYDPASGELRFGYTYFGQNAIRLNQPGGIVFTSLSHDIIAHEMTHAMLDGMRSGLMYPMNQDVDAFHEGFSDIVALLMKFQYRQLVRTALARGGGRLVSGLVNEMARQFGQATGDGRAALRTALIDDKGPDADVDSGHHYHKQSEPHALGGVLVAAVFDAFRWIYNRKVEPLFRIHGRDRELTPEMLDLLAGQAERLAGQFLNVIIRAVDYTPPVDLTFGEYLRAMLTADFDIVPDDPWGYREALVEGFRRYRITVDSVPDLSEDALLWLPPERHMKPIEGLRFSELRHLSEPGWFPEQAELERRANALGRYVTKPTNLSCFGLAEPRTGQDAIERPVIQSIRTVRRIGPDNTLNFDIVGEITQRRRTAGGLWTYGGATVVVDSSGTVRYSIVKHVKSQERERRHKAFIDSAPEWYSRFFDGSGEPPRTAWMRHLHTASPVGSTPTDNAPEPRPRATRSTDPGCLCGAASVDITPSPGRPMAGFSVACSKGEGTAWPLMARVFYFRDAEMRQLALCILDLHSGTGALRQAIGQEAAALTGLSPDEIVVVGTHTHTGPGGIYGNSLYDTFCQWPPRSDRELVNVIGKRVGEAIRTAMTGARRGRVGTSAGNVHGVGFNRSLKAFLANDGADHWNEPGSPGESIPKHVSDRGKAVDPRLTALVAIGEDDRKPIAALVLFGCHATSLGNKYSLYAPDWPGMVAETLAGWLKPYPGVRPVVGVALSGAGDVNTDDGSHLFGTPIMSGVSLKVANESIRCLRRAMTSAEPFDIRHAAHEWNVSERTVGGDPDTLLSDHWMIGESTLSGSEEVGTGPIKEGVTSPHYPKDNPQHPKSPAAGGAGALARLLFDLKAPTRLPLRIVSIGNLVLPTVPGELTCTAAWRLEQRIHELLGPGHLVRPLCYAEEYSGYIVTREEYEMQHYEGASCLYGRNTLNHLIALHERKLIPQLGPTTRGRGSTVASRASQPILVSPKLVSAAVASLLSRTRSARRSIESRPVGPSEEQINEALQSIQEESEGLDDDVLVPYSNRVASLIQSHLGSNPPASFARGGEIGGEGVQFDEHGLDLNWVADATKWVHWTDKHPLPEPTSHIPSLLPDDIRIAVVGDWGTGMYGAPISADSIKRLHQDSPFTLALHLGDIYYSGQKDEVRSRFLDKWPELPGCYSRALNGNHEMFSGGFGYFDDVLGEFGQDASYFAFGNSHFVFVGLDTAFEDHDLTTNQFYWLDRIFEEQLGSRQFVLFSHHQPYSRLGKQGERLMKKFKRILESGRVKAWYWGHEHGCFVYDTGIGNHRGRCVGHGGIPYRRERVVLDAPVELSAHGVTWRRLQGTPGIPSCLVLDGPNDTLGTRRDKYGPHGFLTIETNGPALTETFYLPDGKTVLSNTL